MSDESAVPMEDLLAHRQWVRALARRLAADESSADDLEQETWLAAVQHPPRDARSPRGWLGTVLRNVHRNAARGASRRGRREESVARRETTETADELVAEAETQTLLVREVLALEEPYRATVLLRWFEDLTPGEVAARQGVPLETVRTRLKRAVARLRERMDERHGGDRRAWCLLLLGRDGPGTGAGTGTTAATIAAGGMAMGLATKLTIAAAVLVAAGAFWWSRSDDAAPAARPARTDTAAAPAAPPAPAKREHRADAPSESAAPASAALDLTKVDRDLDLHGTVVRADGSPVAGAKVQAVDYPWRRTMTMDVDALFVERLGPSTTTSADGAFGLRLRRGEPRFLRVSADGLATSERGPYLAGERVKFTMTPAVTLRVSLVDESKSPIAGATLWLYAPGDRGDQPWVSARSVTDTAGRCAFTGLPGGVEVMILPFAGAGDFGGGAKLPETGETSLDMVAPAGRTLTGRVFDAVTLAPISDATVGFGLAWLRARKTDGGGRFEIRGYTGKSERNVYAKARGYAPSGFRVETQTTFDVALRRGVGVAGRMVGADGAPVAGVCVAVQGRRHDGALEQFCCATAVSDAAGRFRVEDLDRATPLVLSALASGSGRVRRPVPPPNGDGDTIDVGDVVLPAPRAIEGRILDAAGAPMPRADVRLVGPGAGAPQLKEEPGSQEQGRTDDLGRFRFGDLAPGEYVVEAYVSSGTPLSRRVTLSAEADVTDVALQAKSTASSVVVTVRDEAGAPLAGVSVMGYDAAQALVGAVTDASGRAVLLPPGESPLVTVGAGGSAFVTSPPVHLEPGRRDVILTVERAVKTTCRLLDVDGKPLARAYLEIEPRGRATVYSTWQADGAYTDAEGRMGLSLPEKGEFSLVFRGRLYDEKRRAVDSLLEARADRVTATKDEIVLTCRRVETGRSVTVRVLDADGAPDVRAQVLIAAAVERQGTTDAEGRVRFDDLAARETEVNTPSRAGMLLAAPVKFVPAGQEIVLRRPAAVSIAGTAMFTGGAPAAEAFVTVMRGDSMVFSDRCDAEGRFTAQVPVGDDGPFLLRVSAHVGKAVLSSEKPLTPQDRDVRVELTKP